MAYNFRPSRPKAAVNSKRLVKRESVFQVERGPISVQKRDVKQLDEFRSRSFMQRGSNKFKTASQRSELTVGEQDIEKHLSKATECTSNQGNQKSYSVQTLPSVQKDALAVRFTSGCFEYVQNYHHYVLDLNKLGKGEHVPYLSLMEKQKSLDSSTKGKSRKEENGGLLTSGTNDCFSALPRRAPKSASRSRRGSAGTRTRTDSNFIVSNAFSNTRDNSPRGSELSSKETRPEAGISEKVQNHQTLQDLIISEMDDKVEEFNKGNKKELTSEIPSSQVDSIYKVPNPSTTDLRAPSGTPVETSRSSSLLHSFPNLPNNWLREVPGNATLQGVTREVHKPYMSVFTTRIPPLKAPDVPPIEERRKRKQNHCIPDYQRYRILCDAFRPIIPQRRRYRQNERPRPNFVTSEELDYYIDVVNSINACNGWY